MSTLRPLKFSQMENWRKKFGFCLMRSLKQSWLLKRPPRYLNKFWSYLTKLSTNPWLLKRARFSNQKPIFFWNFTSRQRELLQHYASWMCVLLAIWNQRWLTLVTSSIQCTSNKVRIWKNQNRDRSLTKSWQIQKFQFLIFHIKHRHSLKNINLRTSAIQLLKCKWRKFRVYLLTRLLGIWRGTELHDAQRTTNLIRTWCKRHSHNHRCSLHQ